MNEPVDARRGVSYCPRCHAASSSPRGVFCFPVCESCRYKYWGIFKGHPADAEASGREIAVFVDCPFCKDRKDVALVAGRYRCSRCSRVFAMDVKRRVFRYFHPLALMYVVPAYLIVLPWLVLQVVNSVASGRYDDSIPAATLVLVWILFRRPSRIA